jgi:hypothetical protein
LQSRDEGFSRPRQPLRLSPAKNKSAKPIRFTGWNAKTSLQGQSDGFGTPLAFETTALDKSQPHFMEESPMQVELYCTTCRCGFTAPPETSAETILERMRAEGPWYPLGDGETFEDMIFSALTSSGDIHCPVCGDPVYINEESLGWLAMEMLTEW